MLTKIGLNLVAKLLGLDLIREPAFDAAENVNPKTFKLQYRCKNPHGIEFDLERSLLVASHATHNKLGANFRSRS